MVYFVASGLSACLLGSAGFLGVRLLHGALIKGAWILLGVYIGWVVAAFGFAFANGLVARAVTALRGKSVFGLIVGILWAGMFTVSAIYLWRSMPYFSWYHVVRAVGCFLALGSGVWAFLMVSLMSGKQ